MLAEHGINTKSVYQQWPKLLISSSDGGVPTTPLEIVSPELDRLFQIVIQLVAEYVNSPILETEHLLLSLLVADNELAHWLNQRGVRSEDVQDNIRNRHGYREGPLPMEPEPIAGEKLQIENCKLQIENCRDSGQGTGFRVQDSGDDGQGTGDRGQCETASGLVHPSSFILVSASSTRRRIGPEKGCAWLKISCDSCSTIGILPDSASNCAMI